MNITEAIEKFNAPDYTPGRELKTLPSGFTLAEKPGMKLIRCTKIGPISPKYSPTYRVLVFHHLHNRGGFTVYAF